MHDLPLIPQLIDVVIGFTALECVALTLYHRLTGAGVAPRDFALNMAAGLCLMAALRSLAHGDGALWVATSLLLAGVAHGADILRRWRRTASAGANETQVTA